MAGIATLSYRVRLALVGLFGVTMAYFEAAVVVYLRSLYYPHGFTFPLTVIPNNILAVELGRELASVVMLASVAALAGRKFWERFGYFAFCFGVWDIFYYVWLKVTLNWPVTLTDWDILYLIPVPWIGPVIAPMLVALLMVVAGLLVARRYGRGGLIRLDAFDWVLGAIATGCVLYSFMRDTGATLGQQVPQGYWYGLLIAGLVLYIVALWRVLGRQPSRTSLEP
jgi:hypothetical protein